MGQYSIRINEQWRICFKWANGKAKNVEIVDYHANGSYAILKKNVKLLDDEDYAIMLRTTNFHKKNEFNYKYITKNAYEFLEKSKLFPGDLIMNKIGDPGVTFYVKDLGKPLSLAMNLFLLRFNNKYIHSKYIYYHLSANYEYICSFAAGTSTKTITKYAVNTLICPLPPLAEARGIISKVENLLTYFDELEQQIDKAQQDSELLMQAVLKEAFEG